MLNKLREILGIRRHIFYFLDKLIKMCYDQALRFSCDEVKQIDFVVNYVIDEFTDNEWKRYLSCCSLNKLSFILKNANKAILVDITLSFRHLSKCIINLTRSEAWDFDLLSVKELVEVFQSDHVFGEQGASRVFICHPNILLSNNFLESSNDSSCDIRDSKVV
jgi:hypothetical protein